MEQTITLDEKIRQRELKDFQLYKQFINEHKNNNTLYSIWQTEQLEHYDVNQIKTNKKDATDISVQYIELKYRNTVAIDDYDNLTALPLEIKSGKDYTEHSALTNFLQTPEYSIKNAIVFSN